MISSVEHLFMCLLAKYMSLFGEVSLQVSCLFILIEFFFILSWMKCLYIWIVVGQICDLGLLVSTSLVAQMVKSLPAVREAWVRSLDW